MKDCVDDRLPVKRLCRRLFSGTLLLGLFAISQQESAFAQAGLTGGIIDKQDKSGVWYWRAGSISVDTVASPRIEMFYWMTILFSQTLGTALGDWMADTNDLGYERGAPCLRRA